MTRVTPLAGLDAAAYRRHVLHADERTWVEKNCYVDVCIELLHALGLEPLAMLGSCAALNFEGDNFTFYKPSHDDLRELYGVDFQELNVWRPLLDHAVLHLGEGKFISTEADAFVLPDTTGTDYRRQHTKTTIVVAELDVDSHRLGYFHNAGYHELHGDDFDQLFGLNAEPDPSRMPLFAELVRIDQLVRRSPDDLARRARRLLKQNVARRPAKNPVIRFQGQFESDLATIQERGLAYYHAWAFATVRQMGAMYELLTHHLRWLSALDHDAALEPAAAEFEKVSSGAKTFILKAARAVNSRKPLDAASLWSDMSGAWDHGMELLAGGR